MPDSTLTTIYKGWETYQGYLIDAFAPLTNDQLALRPAPNLWSVSIIARHIIATRVFWLHAVAGVGKADVYASMQTWDDFEIPVRSAAEIVGGIQTTWGLVQEALALWTPADLETPFTRRRSDGQEETLTRQWIIWHLIEHDVHHGGEISIVLGAHGLTGLDV